MQKLWHWPLHTVTLYTSFCKISRLVVSVLKLAMHCLNTVVVLKKGLTGIIFISTKITSGSSWFIFSDSKAHFSACHFYSTSKLIWEGRHSETLTPNEHQPNETTENFLLYCILCTRNFFLISIQNHILIYLNSSLKISFVWLQVRLCQEPFNTAVCIGYW